MPGKNPYEANYFPGFEELEKLINGAPNFYGIEESAWSEDDWETIMSSVRSLYNTLVNSKRRPEGIIEGGNHMIETALTLLEIAQKTGGLYTNLIDQTFAIFEVLEDDDVHGLIINQVERTNS